MLTALQVDEQLQLGRDYFYSVNDLTERVLIQDITRMD